MRSVGGDEDADGAREGAFQGGPDRDVRYNPSPLSDTAFRYHKYMQFLKQIYLELSLSCFLVQIWSNFGHHLAQISIKNGLQSDSRRP